MAHQATPLHAACQRGRVEVAKLLLSRKASVDAQMKEGFTPLYLACQTGERECARGCNMYGWLV